MIVYISCFIWAYQQQKKYVMIPEQQNLDEIDEIEEDGQIKPFVNPSS